MKIITLKAVKRILIALLFLLTAYIIANQSCSVLEVPPYVVKKTAQIEFQPDRYGKGELVFENGIPILILRGSPEEIGQQQANLLKPQLFLVVDTYLNRFLHKQELEDIAINAMERMKPFVPEAYQKELLELAETTGLSYDRLLLLQTIMDEPRVPYCSVILATEPATSQPGLIFGRNLDFPSLGLAEHYSLITIYHPDNGKSFASIIWPGFVGALSGINQDGLSLALLLSFSSWQTNTAGMPSMMLLRKILEQASTVEEAIKIIRDTKRVSPINLALADANNNSAIVEITAEKIALRQPDRGLFYATNWFVTEDMDTGGGDARYGKIKKWAQKNHGKIGLQETINILGDVAMFRINLQSMVFYPRDRVVHLSIGSVNSAKQEFKRINLKPYFTPR